ncbi:MULTISPECIES: restriction endonuclease subunit S [Enterobacter]|nr:MULTISPECIES: restriction endonuclease subunit S [Enterobacter]MDV5355003.1 restriction endonuclease subunit S [Enterobacter asburiae]MCF2294235.1 restriction endonuclease subunit S [Enterobacter hormaechei]MCF2334466.1 restriction endonuclease subunit S [Enterobacter hormaechei]MCF2392155.1 restriction endonuclease subunit S [Enterobacter hormaechei]MCI2676336.1 restriction endonuclease subunit S [Enterobacter hormaechei]
MGMILELCEKMEVNGKSMPQVSFPEGWELRLLGELATIFSGGTPNRKNPEYWDGDIPWITTTLIDGSEIFEANEFITQNGLKGSSAKWCKAGTILMAMYGQGKTRGKVALLGIDATINQACAAIELSELCSKEYVLHLLISKYEQIRELSNSGGQENLSSGIIKRLEVLIPPKKEQIIIAKVLSDTNALITEFGELIAKKQAIKTATMQQLLTGRTRLPQFSKHSDGTLKGHRSSELGAIPEDWQVVPFKNVLTIKHGKNQKEVESPSGQYPIYATGGQIGNATSFLFDKPSVLIGRKGTIDKPRYAETPFWTVDTLFYSEIKKDFCVKFIYYKFCMIDWMQYNEASGVPSLNAHTIENVLVTLPNLEEQTAIASILSDMDDELKALEQKLAKTRDLKQGMMQQLLTGRIRLPLEQQS